MYVVNNVKELSLAVKENIIKADVFFDTDSNSPAKEHERLEKVWQTLNDLMDAFQASINIEQMYIVTGHLEGDTPITRAIKADSLIEAEKKYIDVEAYQDKEIYIDSTQLLSSILPKAPVHPLSE